MNLDLTLYDSSENLWIDFEKSLKLWKLDKEPMIKKAFELALKMHTGQKRNSGHDYVVHPVWVAKVIAQLGVGRRAIVAALLHDTIEDTSLTIEDIAREFDDEVALLVDGLTDVKKITRDVEVHMTNVEVFRKFLFSSVDDVRVLIIRTVDKLHNMLTIQALSPNKQKRYAERVLGIYSPVAEYVGLHYFKRLLDDNAFRILHPKETKKLEKLLADSARNEIKAMGTCKNEIESLLKANRIHEYEIQSRIKGLYSTYQKIKNKGADRLKDRVGLRIITDTVANCYTILGLLHSKYTYIPEEFNDYISSPKPSGYRSLQTTIYWKDQLTLEIQVRTREMHEFNEFGPASHIAYKLSKEEFAGSVGYEWVKELVKWQKGDENVNNYRIKVLEKYIYVFTPKGDTIQMPAGSTALDFAYRIHGEIGNHCIGAKINKKMGKIDTILKTGDLVEILTSKKVQRNNSISR
jgi:guanosine-3',5'-bis(diphosphate) 3'-pyrophosphohydrolase